MSPALSRRLSWSHFVELFPLEDSLKHDFYAELCRVERWSVRTLRHKIGNLLYEWTAVSRKPDVLIAKHIAALRNDNRLTPDMVFRDPYFPDLLFYNHRLRCLAAIDLKLGKFQATDKGQMELFLRWFHEHVM
ncbi:MAG UNVERIFIED_CONTAM: PDDEXK nuclease domain-containing protein [Planctomycetaceae bacterium]